MELKDFKPRPMREVEYFGAKISIPSEHEWLATGDDGVVYSYSTKPEELNGMWIIPQRHYGAEDMRIGTFILAGEPGAIETLRHYPKEETTHKPEYFVFNPPMREVEYFGRIISIPVNHEWLATDGDGEIYSYSKKPEYDEDIMAWACGSSEDEFRFIGEAKPIGAEAAAISLWKV